ncbi:MAG: alpha/beta fold hydrolase [Deltaproteobacteria bacterium]|nr:alpha/beta fold hydrolase [Deltaproteobacteria bacterium]
MLSLFHQLPQYWMDGAIRSLDGLRHGLTEPFPMQEDPPSVTPYTVIYEEGKVRLRYYQAAGMTRTTPLLIVYPLIKRPFILDLLLGKSVVQNLLAQGIDVYLTDWIPPTRADSWRGFDAYVNGDVANAVRAVQAHSGTEQVPLLGYCFGALLATIYTALHPETVDNLITLTLPLDMSAREIPLFHMLDKLRPETIHLLTATYGNCPAWFVKTGFTAMSPVHHALDKYMGLYRNQEKEGYAEMFDLFERWMNSDVPLAGRIFREVTQDIFQKNLLRRNQLRVGGEVVDLRRITCPVLNAVAEHDDVVHPQSSLPLPECIGSTDKANLIIPTGHVGVAVSAAAHKKLWPHVGQWLREHAAPPPAVRMPHSSERYMH